MKTITVSTRNSQRGFAFVWLALGMTALMGMGAVAIDISMWYARKADLQKTADNASLAGAFMLAHGGTIAQAVDKANQIASLNGYSLTMPADHSNPNATSASDIKYPVGTHNSWFSVRVQNSQIPFFARVLGHGAQHLEATATAEYQAYVDAPIPVTEAGYNGLDTNYSVFGPYAWRAYGDQYSPMYESTSTPGPKYVSGTSGPLLSNNDFTNNQKGYDFTITVPSDFSTKNPGKKLQIDIFDPDCINKGGATDASAIVKDPLTGLITGGTIDEIRNGQSGRTDDYTKTDFKVVFTPDALGSTDKVIADQVYWKDATTDLQWVTPPGFTFDPAATISQYGSGRFHVQVKSIDGSSENGFNIRSGPEVAAADLKSVTVSGQQYTLSNISETAWHNKYSGDPATASAGKNGTQVAAHGRIPLNFNANGKADILLGYVPANAAGGTITVDRFDTDIAPSGQSNIKVTYTCDTLGTGDYTGWDSGHQVSWGSFVPGVCNNTVQTDTIPLSPTYSGGNWTAHYWAGGQDSSSWTLHATVPGGSINLVGDVGQLH
ncbi:MAG: Tad domain-containing protein [Capsulimonas sp.]|uniref:Tad domain-containing protein n=1 Tax=Capsulimonas sp. TaxID=2494211 RepID=UPI003267364E